MAEPASSLGSVAFHDVAIYFSQVEWKLLEDWQKELYKNVIKEIHGALISMGYAIDNPGILFRIKKEERHALKDEEVSDGEELSYSPLRQRLNRCHPDIFLRMKEEEESEEPCLRDQQDSDGGENLMDPHSSYSPNDPDMPFKIKEVDDSYFLDHPDSEESNSEDPSNDQEWIPPGYAESDLTNEGSTRHASVSEMEIDILEANRNEVSTKRHTKWAVSIFKGWLAEKHLDMSFETISKTNLNKILREFFATVRNSSGKQYSISSYAGLRAGVNRFFNDTRRINIVKDPEFTTANNVFIGVMKSLRKLGKDVSEHNPRISDMDLQILKSSPVLSINTARGLVSKVWFDVQFYFARRGQEGHRDLMPQSFKMNKDEQGIEYVTLAFSDKSRHHPIQLKTNKENVHGCMYSLPGNPLCPVNSFKKYLSKLPENPPAFYLHPIKVRPELLESQPVWYTKEPLGINYLRRMMPSISQEAGLSLRYTNHSIWSTVLYLFSNSGLQARHIMSDTGHKKEISIGRYWAESTEDRKRLFFLVPVAAPSTSAVDRGLLPMALGLGTPVKAESSQPSS
ncbi:uncharacterized protein [Ambystoma mexicanum]|uniref:uncharacterized protein isoform X2 n=1 Tax=Ambystoma mexicanum TaxID=8296 RepID=UPI0037E81D40